SAEAGTVLDHFAHERLAEIRFDVEEGIERAVRNRAADPGQRSQPFAHNVAASLELAAHLLDAGLVAFDGCDGGMLTDCRGATGFLALYVAHCFYDMSRAN